METPFTDMEPGENAKETEAENLPPPKVFSQDVQPLENAAKVTNYNKINLLSRLTVPELKAIQKGFPIASEDNEPKRDIDQFCELLSSVISDGKMAEFQELFDIIDTDKEGFVDWDKFCSHMQRDYQEKDDRRKTTQVPQWRELKYITSPHKESIQRITMLANPPRYVTLSKEGVAVVWSLNMKPLRTIYVTTEPDEVKQRDLWVTDFVPMQNIYKLALALTSKEIAIYDLSSKSEFLCQYRVRGLKSTPISLDYWSNPENSNESILIFGNVFGNVNALIFCASNISLFDRPAQTNANQQDITLLVDIGDIAKGNYKNCRYVYHNGHTEWTRQVMYNSVLECFISCATNYKNALVLGWREKAKSNMRTTVFRISQGVNAFDYNEKMNLIATAGVNHQVLLWNPYVISKPVGVLRGHMQSVVCVRFIESRGQTVSLSKDKVLRIWDTHLQVCLQRLSGIFPKGPEVYTVMFFDEERSTLLTAFNHRLSILVMKPEIKDRIVSHEHPVIGAIYNRKFNQVVSACVGSVVIMWMIDTGQKVKQFTNAHGDSEITTLTQDTSETRLFTGSTDGTVKIWDFNGHCHHVLVAGDGNPCDIAEVLPLKRMILVVGWDRTLCVFRDNQLTSYYVHPSDWKGRQEHQDDIQCMSFIAPHTLASASYDGELVLWNTSSEQAFRHLGCRARKTARINKRLRKLEQTGSPVLRSRDTTRQLTAPINDDISTLSLEDETEDSETDLACFINKLLFLENRPSPATADAANLVSCGANGWVRFWNTNHNVCVGEFVAHFRSGAITMETDQHCRYLVTGDSNGLVKVWNITDYCAEAIQDAPVTKAPPLHKHFQPHLDSITTIEIFERFERTLVLTSSSDCSVAVWDIHGRHLGIFGQEEHWKIEDIPIEQPVSDDEEDEHVQVGFQDNDDIEVSAPIDFSNVNSEKEPLDHESLISTWDYSILGKAYCEPRKQKRQRRQPETKLNKTNYESIPQKNTSLASGTYSSLDTQELSSVNTLHKPDFVCNPRKYFSDDFAASQDANGLSEIRDVPPVCETISMRYDEKNLFPRFILEREAKMKAAHVLATTRASRATTRAGTRTGKPSPDVQKPAQHVKTQKKRHVLSPQLESPAENFAQ